MNRYILLLINLLIVPCLFAQPTFTASEYAGPGDGFIISRADIVQNSGLNYDTTGANITWDFSTLTPLTQIVDSFFDPFGTAHYAGFYTDCYLKCYDTCFLDTCTAGFFACLGICDNDCRNYCNQEFANLTNLGHPLLDTIDLGVVRITDMYNFFKTTSTTHVNTMLGFKLEEPQTGLAATELVEYTNPDTVYRFPLQYGNTDNNSSSFDLVIDFAPFYEFSFAYLHRQHRSNEVEGWGTLITPYGSFDSTLKVKTILHVMDTVVWNDTAITLASLVGESLAPDSIIEYKWFHKDLGIPLVTVRGFILDGNTFLLGIDYIDSLRCFEPSAFFGTLPILETFLDSTDTAQVNCYSLSLNADSLSWNFDDPASGAANFSGEQNPVHYYTSSGTYSISLTACNTSPECTQLKCDTFVLPFLVIDTSEVLASFFSTPTFPCSGDTVFFTNTSVKDTAWFWDFGDTTTLADTSILADPFYIYPSVGTYEVMLIAYNSISSDTVRKTVNIEGLVNTSFSWSDTVTRVPIQFNNTTIGTDSNSFFIWTFSGGSPNILLSFEEHPVVTFNQPGMVNVCMTAWNSAGCSETVCDSIRIFECLDAGLMIAPAKLNYCTSDSLILTNQTTTEISATATYHWLVNGMLYAVSPDTGIRFDSAGTYTITLAAGNGVCTDTISQTVTVRDFASIYAGKDTAICAGDTVALMPQFDDGNQTSYFVGWTPSDSLSSTTIFNPLAFPGVSTDYIISVTFILGACNGIGTIRDTIRIEVNDQPPVAGFSIQQNQATVVLIDTSQSTTGRWYDFGDGQTDTARHPVHTYTDTGTYVITQYVSNACDTDSVSQIVTINCTPGLQADFSLQGDTLCLDDTLMVTNLSTGADQYVWDFGDGTMSTDPMPTGKTYDSSGSYQIMLTASDTLNCQDMTFDTVHVLGIPVADFNIPSYSTLDISFIDQSTNATSWYWNFGDGYTSTEQHPVHTYGQNAVYVITLKVSSPCGEDSISREENIHLFHIGEASVSPEFSIQPNPYIGTTVISVELIRSTFLGIQVFDIMGRHVTTLADDELGPGKYQYAFSARELDYPAGIYLLRWKIDHQNFTTRLVELK